MSPVIKGLLDVTLGIFPHGPSSQNGNGKCKDVKKSASKSATAEPPGGRGGVNRNVVRLAGISGALAVGLGAYGAHGK